MKIWLKVDVFREKVAQIQELDAHYQMIDEDHVGYTGSGSH